MDLYKTSKLVEIVLRQNPKTRDDDYLLWFVVLETAYKHTYPSLFDYSIEEFLTTLKDTKFPRYETVSRVRRKLQAEYPELRSTEKTKKARAGLEAKYREYAISN